MACTTILVGKNASYDGSTMVARNDDSGSGHFTAKKFVVVQPEEHPAVYRSVISHVEVPLPGHALRMTAMPNAVEGEGIWAAAGVNAAHVGMTATETITSNPRVLGADPLVVYQPAKGERPEVPGGIGEEDIVCLVLPYIRTAREGVVRLGELLRTYGTYEMNGIAFQDVNEIWWLETIGGHHWIARRVPDDVYVVMPNQLGLDSFDLTDALGRVKETYETFTNSTGVDGIVDYILKNHIEELFVGTKPSELPPETYQALIDNGKSIHLSIRPMIGIQTDNQFITTVGTYKALGLGVYSFTGKQMIYMVVKRFMDIVFGLIGLVALLPLMLIVKVSFLLGGDRKPIFYTQTRVGLNGQPFQLIKFRSMVWNAGDILEEMLKDPSYAKEWAENQKFEHDPRITKMGGFLRKTSLDEVPQFINVLKGDMSAIGPRPLVPGELEQHGGLQLYNQVKPGITGWWGCNGRSNTTYDERLELEYYYVKNCSLWMDALTVVKTAAAILKRDGAK